MAKAERMPISCRAAILSQAATVGIVVPLQMDEDIDEDLIESYLEKFSASLPDFLPMRR